MTYGELRYTLSKMLPGVDHDLLDGWIQTRYQEILDKLPWQRLDARAMLQTVAEYNTGTVDLVNGSTAITGVGTVWTTAMNNRMIRFAGEDTYYEFTRTGATSGTIDRNYEGSTASDVSHQINAPIYTLPSDLRILRLVSSFALERELTKLSLAELSSLAPTRNQYGHPQYYAIYMDQNSDPPLAQIELYPVPDAVASLSYEYTADVAAPSTTTSSILPWMRPAALIAGVRAEAAWDKENFNVGNNWDSRFKDLLSQMVMTAAVQTGPVPMVMHDRYTRHRTKRWAE